MASNRTTVFPTVDQNPRGLFPGIQGENDETAKDLNALFRKLGVQPSSNPNSPPDPSTPNGDNSVDTDQSASGRSFITALLNGQITAENDADFILNMCNQDDLFETDELLITQHKSKGGSIPRTASSLLENLDALKTWNKLRKAFEIQMETLVGPPLTNAVNRFCGDMVSLLQPSARLCLQILTLIMSQHRGKEFSETKTHIISCRVVQFWKNFVWTHEDSLVTILDIMSERGDPNINIPTNQHHSQAPGWSRLTNEFYATPNSIALVTKVMLKYVIKPTYQKLNPEQLRDRFLIKKRSGHPMIMKNNDAENWITHNRTAFQELTTMATITGDLDLIPTAFEMANNHRSAVSQSIHKLMKEWATNQGIALSKLDLNSLERWMLHAQSVLELNEENDRIRVRSGGPDVPDTPISAPTTPAKTTNPKKGGAKKSTQFVPTPQTAPAAPTAPATQTPTSTPNTNPPPSNPTPLPSAGSQPSAASPRRIVHPTTGLPLDPNNPADLSILRAQLPCRDLMNNGACTRSAGDCRYSHDPSVITAGIQKLSMAITSNPTAGSAPAAVPVPPAQIQPNNPVVPSPVVPSTTHNLNSYSPLEVEQTTDSDSDSDDFPLERISKPTHLGGIHMLRSSTDVGHDQLTAATMDLDHDDRIDLSRMEDEETQLETAIADPTVRTITHFFKPDTHPSPIKFDEFDSDDSDDDTNTDDDSDHECPHRTTCTSVTCTRCLECTDCCECSLQLQVGQHFRRAGRR